MFPSPSESHNVVHLFWLSKQGLRFVGFNESKLILFSYLSGVTLGILLVLFALRHISQEGRISNKKSEQVCSQHAAGKSM